MHDLMSHDLPLEYFATMEQPRRSSVEAADADVEFLACTLARSLATSGIR